MIGTDPVDAGLLGKDSLQSNWPSDVLPWNAYPFRYASAHELSTEARRFGYRQRDDAGRYFLLDGWLPAWMVWLPAVDGSNPGSRIIHDDGEKVGG
jgi:hypothetical protein